MRVTNTSLVKSCICWAVKCFLILLYFREPVQEGGAVEACWTAHDLCNHASDGRRVIDD